MKEPLLIKMMERLAVWRPSTPAVRERPAPSEGGGPDGERAEALARMRSALPLGAEEGADGGASRAEREALMQPSALLRHAARGDGGLPPRPVVTEPLDGDLEFDDSLGFDEDFGDEETGNPPWGVEA